MQTLEELDKDKLLGQKEIKISEELTTFPKALYTLVDTLEVLDLSDNKLSSLPDDFDRFKKLKILFLFNNSFNHIPKILAKLPNLTMIGFRNNQIEIFEENSLPLTTRWLILTDNSLKKLPESIGELKQLQKFMLSGNQLETLPKSLAKCTNLELLRVAANKLDTFPTFLLSLPKLSWFAYGGNPFCLKHPKSDSELKTIPWEDLKIEQLLGEGTSGNIYKAIYEKKEVAIKIFKGEITSDGLPSEEMDINIALNIHENLVDVLGKVINHPKKKDILMFELIPQNYKNLGLPPSLESCTRDVYPSDFSLELKSVLKILKGMALACMHMHDHGIMHGDFYAHNIMIDDSANAILGDFGAASYYEANSLEIENELEQLEVRAYGCLVEELLLLSKYEEKDKNIADFLYELQLKCLDEVVNNRPLFSEIVKGLEEL